MSWTPRPNGEVPSGLSYTPGNARLYQFISSRQGAEMNKKPSRTRCKPSSVPPAPRARAKAAMAIYLDPASRPGSSRLPGKAAYPRPSARTTPPAHKAPGPLLGLAPGGVCPAADLAADAVRSYRTFSPLPSLAKASEGGMFSVALSLSRPASRPRRWALPTTAVQWCSDFPLPVIRQRPSARPAKGIITRSEPARPQNAPPSSAAGRQDLARPACH